MNDTLVIPDDLAACQKLILELAQTVGEVNENYQRAKETIAELELTIDELLQRAFPNTSARTNRNVALANRRVR